MRRPGPQCSLHSFPTRRSSDLKEYLRLGMLLEQTFPEARIQMVTSAIKPSGSHRSGEFARVEEYVYFVMFGSAKPALSVTDMFRGESGEKSCLVSRGRVSEGVDRQTGDA